VRNQQAGLAAARRNDPDIAACTNAISSPLGEIPGSAKESFGAPAVGRAGSWEWALAETASARDTKAKEAIRMAWSVRVDAINMHVVARIGEPGWRGWRRQRQPGIRDGPTRVSVTP